MKVLIAEDEAISRLVLHKAVQRLGHECLVAEDGRQAWEMLATTSVEVHPTQRLTPPG